MISRDIIHIPTAGISILCAMNGKQAKIVFAYCNPRDNFNRKIANEILLGRLNSEHGRKFLLSYLGTTPRKDILFPIADFIREELGYHFDVNEKKFYHPETFAVPGVEGFISEMDVVEPTTRVARSVTQLHNKVRNFIDTTLRPQLEAPFKQKYSNAILASPNV